MVSGQAGLVKGRFDVRFGSKADICAATNHVRFTPDSDRKSGHAAMVMSALLLKADIDRRLGNVCFVPIAASPSYSITLSSRVSRAFGDDGWTTVQYLTKSRRRMMYATCKTCHAL